jgi:16S rRNA (adenine1518-N6/adenine1519-N6)-dimethyltransferase
LNREDYIKPKKSLGQHFLKDRNIAHQISEVMQLTESIRNVLEIGPGKGVLTDFLNQRNDLNVKVVELDAECVPYLKSKYGWTEEKVIQADFLKLELGTVFTEEMAIIGNFPYNISTQIVFKVIENRRKVPMMVGMFQKEVAQRICSPAGSKVYGITSVLTQAYYKAEYLFEVGPEVFDPPPAVHSAVIRLTRLPKEESLQADAKKFSTLVKTAFNQRRKTLRNALKSILPPDFKDNSSVLHKRAEQLSVKDFVLLMEEIEQSGFNSSARELP